MKKRKGKLKPQALDFFAKAGRRGAKRRQQTVSPERRREIAQKAARSRWAKKGKP